MSFKLNDRSELPNTWRKFAQSFARQIGEAKMVSRIAGWWSESNQSCKLDTGASHLLKHFVWLLETVDEGSAVKPTCDELVCSLSTVEWKPKPPAAKIVASAACYLVKLPTDLAWDPLQELCTVASSRTQKVHQLVAEYAASHDLDFVIADRPSEDESLQPAPSQVWWKFWRK